MIRVRPNKYTPIFVYVKRKHTIIMAGIKRRSIDFGSHDSIEVLTKVRQAFRIMHKAFDSMLKTLVKIQTILIK